MWRMGTANRKLLAALKRRGSVAAPSPEPERAAAVTGPAEPRPDVLATVTPPKQAEPDGPPQEPAAAEPEREAHREQAPRPQPPRPEDEFRRLTAALRSPDPFVRVEAVAALRRRPQAEDQLIRALDDEFPMVRREAVRSIRYATPSRAR